LQLIKDKNSYNAYFGLFYTLHQYELLTIGKFSLINSIFSISTSPIVGVPWGKQIPGNSSSSSTKSPGRVEKM